MKRLAFALTLVAACGGKTKPDSTSAGSGSGSAIYAKKVSLGWGIEPNGSTKADVFLTATDETGKAVSYPLGTYDGRCQVATPAPEMKAITGVHCANGATSTDLHAVIQGDAVIVLKLSTVAGATPDPMAREQITQFSIPAGAKIEAGT
jgi:hypothetical protein